MSQLSRKLFAVVMMIASLGALNARAEAEWMTDYEAALAKAGAEGKAVLANFTGSDWCGWCIKLHKEVFKHDEFEAWADENVVLLELDYPRDKSKLSDEVKAQNEELKKKYKIRGYPTILLLNAKGETIGKTGYAKGGPNVWCEQVSGILEKVEDKIVTIKKEAKLDRKWLTGQGALREKWDNMHGEDAPSLESLKGWINSEAVNWDDLKGKVVVLDYWATWCGPCVAGIPKLKKMTEKYEDEVVVLGVHSKNGFAKMPAMANQKQINYVLAADEDGAVGKALGIQFLPSYFVIDQSGKMFAAGVNPGSVEAAVKELLATGNVSGGAKVELDEHGFPKAVKKQLFAEVDVRGKALGELGALKWIGGEIGEGDNKPRLISLGLVSDDATMKSHAKILKWHEKISDQVNVVFIYYNGDKDAVKASTESLAMGGGTFLAYDEKMTLINRLKVIGVPHVLLVDSKGIVRWQGYPRTKEDKLNVAKISAFISADKKQGEAKVGAAEASTDKVKAKAAVTIPATKLIQVKGE